MSEFSKTQAPQESANDLSRVRAETASFLADLASGDTLYLKDEQGKWVPATFVSVNEGGLHGAVVQLDVDGESRTMYPRILMDLQRNHDAENLASESESEEPPLAEAA